MKKLVILILLLAFLLSLVSCQTNKTNEANYSIKNIPLSVDEQAIADLNCDFVKKYEFEPGKSYDVKIYLFTKGKQEEVASILDFKPEQTNNTILFSGRKSGDIAYDWSILGAYYETKKIDDSKFFTMVSGVGKDVISLESGKEYILAFIAYQENQSVFSSQYEDWTTLYEEQSMINTLPYAYIVTAKLSDTK